MHTKTEMSRCCFDFHLEPTSYGADQSNVYSHCSSTEVQENTTHTVNSSSNFFYISIKMANSVMSKFRDFPEYQVAGAKEVNFNPYESNGG